MKALYKSTLKFRTDQEESNFMDWVAQRHNAIRIEQGVDGPGCYTGWMKKRVDWEQEFLNNFDHRCNDPRYGELYRLYGTSENIPKRAISVYTSRTREQILGADIFASFMPEGPEDEISPIPAMPGGPPVIDPIRQAERYWQRKIMDGGVRASLRSAIQRAGYVGECVLKTSRALLPGFYERTLERVWLDGPDGQPIIDSAGRFVYEEDAWEPSADVVGVESLRRDPNTIKPPTAVLSDDKRPVRDRPPKRGLAIDPVNFKDFVCSTTAKDIHTTDYIAQEFDFDVDQLLNDTYGAPMSAEAKQWLDTLAERVNDSENQSQSGQPNRTLGEEEHIATDTLGKMHLAESWLRYNVSGRKGGRTEEVYVLWDVKTKHPIYYEFMEIVSQTGRRPYDVVRPIPVADRWYGMSFYELLSNEHNFIDLQKTRLNHRNSRASSVKFLRSGALKEVQAGWKFDLNRSHVWNYTPEQNDKDAPLKVVELPKIDDGIWNMLADARQAAKVMSGTITPADAAAADLNESKTLGQTQLLNAESEMMSNDIGQDVMEGMTGALKQSIVCLFADITDPDHGPAMESDMNEILGAERGRALAEWLKSNNVRKLLNYVRLLMTKTRSREQMQANEQARQILVGDATWLQIEQMGPAYTERFRPLYVGMLNALEVQNAENLCRLPLAAMATDPNGTPLSGAPPGAPAGSDSPVPAPEPPSPNQPSLA